MEPGNDSNSRNQAQFGGDNPEFLHKQLSMSMIQKDQLEQEFWRHGKAKTRLQIERKKELEIELERSNQGIQQIKNRLKDIGALNVK